MQPGILMRPGSELRPGSDEPSEAQAGEPPDGPTPSRDIRDLIAIMSALRTPETGCAWDLEQTFATVAPYAIEEAYEVADAVARGDMEDLRDELGDLLLQVVFQARLAEEGGTFDFGGVVEAITSKLIRRHPHVFGEARSLSPERVKVLWDEIKRAEKAERAQRRGLSPSPAAGVLADVPVGLPALTRADALARKAASVGFTWSRVADVVEKIDEELAELREAAAAGPPEAIAEEYGDLLFTVAVLGRHIGVDPETALAAANAKFVRRFSAVERALASEGRSPAQSDLGEMDRLWNAAKAADRTG